MATKVEGVHDALVEKLVAGLKVSLGSVGSVDESREVSAKKGTRR